MNKTAMIQELKMNIPTYGVGKEEKNPMFFEKRVYQGSSGKVYPNAVIEKIHDELQDCQYNAVVLENDWIKVIVLPELGGRIYTAYDKTNGFDFVYHNQVIKPALVGLLGPWISGGIEFNWPQHHRPNTYKSVKYKLERADDGSVAVYVGEVENMFTLEQTTCIRIYSDKNYIEISSNIHNRGHLPQTFLWWANPAFKVNDNTRTIMPHDVTAVMDHGKRAVSTFPIATGEYYKYDYSAGVDISRYKNIYVPTSFMAYKSNFDFVGGYDDEKNAGLLHVADHHISPGKKQWTWGSGDFGIAWDRNLTDEDGAYVELMTGCFTDNQPDFTYIQPQETKNFTQYFMPYHAVGAVANANKDICFGVENGQLTICSFITCNAEVAVMRQGKAVYNQIIELYPTMAKNLCKVDSTDDITVSYCGKTLKYKASMVENFEIPSPATPCPIPSECKTQEELYIYGTHIEQYRHATRSADDYYLEGLSRDKDDSRINTAYGILCLRRGDFATAIECFDRAIARRTVKNPNPLSSEAHYYGGMANFYIGKLDKAYDMFYKCVWANESKSAANYMLAVIDFVRGDNGKSLEFVQKCLETNTLNIRAYILKANILLKNGDTTAAKQVLELATVADKLDAQSCYELAELAGDKCSAMGNVSAHEAIVYATDYIMLNMAKKAESLLCNWIDTNHSQDPMVLYYIGFAKLLQDKDATQDIGNASHAIERGEIHFPNSVYDMIVLEKIIEVSDNAQAYYYLGNYYYDKKSYSKANVLWGKCMDLAPNFATAFRNSALYYYNKKRDSKQALILMNRAFEIDKNDSRIFMELISLMQIEGASLDVKLPLLQDNLSLCEERDDLYTDYIKCIFESGDAERAYEMITTRHFHPWEGGEGKVTKLYKGICLNLADKAANSDEIEDAIKWCNSALNYPENLGEGKLCLDNDNDVYYHLACIQAQSKDKSEANATFKLAAKGNYTVSENMYYNDAPIDYFYYQALANVKLGKKSEAIDAAKALANYANINRDKHQIIDYFAVSLPDLLIWEQDLDARNRQFCDCVQELSNKISNAIKGEKL